MQYKLITVLAAAMGITQAAARTHGERSEINGVDVRWQQLARGVFTGVAANEWNDKRMYLILHAKMSTFADKRTQFTRSPTQSGTLRRLPASVTSLTGLLTTTAATLTTLLLVVTSHSRLAT